MSPHQAIAVVIRTTLEKPKTMRSRQTVVPAFLATIGILFTVIVTGGPAPAGAEEPDARPYEVGTVPVYAPPNASSVQGTFPPAANPALIAVADAERRRLYQVFISSNPGSRISAFDLDSGSLIRTAPIGLPAGNTSLVARDATRGRFFLVKQIGTHVGGGGLIRVDEAALEAGAPDAIREFASAAPELTLSTPIGLSVDVTRNKVLMWVNGTQDAPEGAAAGLIGRGRMGYYFNWLVQYDAETGREDWVHRVSQCSAGMLNMGTSNAEPFYAADGKSINLMCGSGDNASQLVSIEVDASGKPNGNTRFSVVGPTPLGRVIMDTKRERAYIFVGIGHLVVYNWRDGRVLGTVAISPVVSHAGIAPGLDPESGRLFVFLAPTKFGNAEERGGLLVIDAYRTPVPQALVYRDIRVPSGPPRAVVAPATKTHPRLVLGRGTFNSTAGYPFYNVVADPTPLSTDPPESNVDRTTDTDEADGKTERSFAGETSGYGARTILVGGVIAQGQTGGTLEGDTVGRCPISSRDIISGYVRRASLSNLVAAASGTPLDADLGTQEDARDLSRCWTVPSYVMPGVPPPAGTNTGPGLQPALAQCSGDAADTKSDPKNVAGTARVTCERAKDVVTAVAGYPVAGAGPVSIGRSTTSNSLRRDPQKGLVASVESAVENVTIESGDTFLKIGRVYSYAEAASNGRKSKAPDPRTKWTVLVCGVQVPGFTQQGCSKPDEAVRALNEAGRNRLVFKQPPVETYLQEGTPGGYLAGIQRQAGDLSLARLEHGDDLFIVPGLEIQVRNDNTKSYNRYIVQLAGVRAVSAYGVSVLPEAVSQPDLPSTVSNDDSSGSPVIPDLGAELADFVGMLASAPPRSSGGGGGGGIGGVGDIVDAAAQLIKNGWDLLIRDPVDALLLAGAWSTVAAPAYLALRRRRLGSIA